MARRIVGNILAESRNRHGSAWFLGPFSELCPLEIENNVTLKEHAGVTTLLLKARPFGESAPERQYFEDLRASGSLNEGYDGTFERLFGHLGKA